MNKLWVSIIVVFVFVLGASLALRWYGSQQPSPSSFSESLRETSFSEETETETRVSPTKTAQLVSGIQLTVTNPSGNVTVSSASLTVRGKTVAGAEVFVNDLETKADSTGNFSVMLTLDEGENYILVVANDINGNYAEKEYTITYTP